jgi:hypothetical protein
MFSDKTHYELGFGNQASWKTKGADCCAPQHMKKTVKHPEKTDGLGLLQLDRKRAKVYILTQKIYYPHPLLSENDFSPSHNKSSFDSYCAFFP